MSRPEPLAVPFAPWDRFRPWFGQRWRQGEHVSLIGPTGVGKTTLANDITTSRDHVIYLGTKPRDDTLQRLISRHGFYRIKAWPSAYSWRFDSRLRTRAADDGRTLHRLILWPDFTGPESMNHQTAVFDEALSHIFADGGWTVVVDEVFYLCHNLALTQWLETLWTQGRSLGLTVVAGTQRPAFVPLYMYDQASHLFAWADNDETNLRRVGGLGGLSGAQVRATVSALPAHEALYLGTRDRALVRTRVV